MSFSNLSNDFIKDRANNLKSTVKVMEQSLESDKQRREKISKEIVSLDQYRDKIVKEINTEMSECKNMEIMIGYLESCEKCRVTENESNFSFTHLNPLKFTEIELMGLLFSKRSSMRNTPIELLQLKPSEFLTSIYDTYSLSELKSELINQINEIYQNKNHNININININNNNNHIYISEDEIDLFTPICPFELNGECTDIGCPYQHIRKTEIKNKEKEKSVVVSSSSYSSSSLIVIPIPKNYSFLLKRKYRIEPLNTPIPLYYKHYTNDNNNNNNNNNKENEINELLNEINGKDNNNNSYYYIVPESLQPELLLNYLLNLTNNNNIYQFYNQLKSNSKSLVFIDYVLTYISSILQSHRTVSYVWNIYLNFYFLRQWTNVKDVLNVSKIFKDFSPFNVIGYCLIINELSHWNIDSVILLNYYLNACKECSISIIKNPEENDIDLTFNLIKQLIYYSYSIGYCDIINSLFSSIIKSNSSSSSFNSNSSSSSSSGSYILDGGDIYYNILINIFSLSQISILFSLYLYFQLYKQLPPYSITNFPFFVKKIVIVQTQSQISSLYQCYKTLNSFCNENELNKYEINSYVDIYGLETMFYSYKWISELCRIEYNNNHLNILKKEYNLFNLIYKLNDNNILSNEDIKGLKSCGYLSILTHYKLLNIKTDDKISNKDDKKISLKDKDKNIVHILLQWCNYNENKEILFEEAIKYLYKRSEEAYKISINEIANKIMNCVENNKTNYNMLLNSIYSLEICCLIKNLYEIYVNNNDNNKYVDIIIETLNEINEKINYEKLLLISPYKSSISFIFQTHSILLKSLLLFQCEIPISKWFNYIKRLSDKLEMCYKDISLYFDLYKSNNKNGNENENKSDLQPLQIYNLCSYYYLLYENNNNNYIDSFLSTLFEIVKPFLNCNITEGVISISSNVPTYCLLLMEYLWNNNESNQIKEIINNIRKMELFQFDSIIPSIVHYDLLYSLYERCSIYKLFDLLERYINYYPFQWKVWRYGMIIDVEYGDDQDSTTYLVKEFIQRSLFIDPR